MQGRASAGGARARILGGVTFAAPARALVRAVPASYVRCLRQGGGPVDPGLARAQVEAYARALEACGVAVERLATDEACPDACFVEDVAVVLDPGLAVATRPGAPSRRAEVAPVAAALRRRVADVRPLAPEDDGATLDGGDVLRAGAALLVGLSARTNRAGAAALARHAAPRGLEVVAVPVPEGLHLKSALTLVAPGLAVALAGAPGADLLRARGVRVLETDEPHGANVLALGPVVLVSAAAPRTRALLAREPGVEPRALDVSALHAGDGALTCLSLRVPPPGAWCA